MKAKIEISGKKEWLGILKEVFIEKPEDKRSKAKVYLTGEKFMVEITAEDLTALRASVNSYLRLIRACVDTLEVIENE